MKRYYRFKSKLERRAEVARQLAMCDQMIEQLKQTPEEEWDAISFIYEMNGLTNYALKYAIKCAQIEKRKEKEEEELAQIRERTKVEYVDDINLKGSLVEQMRTLTKLGRNY